MLSMTKGMIIFTRMSKICESYSNKLHQIVFNQIEIYIYIHRKNINEKKNDVRHQRYKTISIINS